MLDMRRKCEPYFDSLTKSEMLFKVSFTAGVEEASESIYSFVELSSALAAASALFTDCNY